MRKKLYDFAQIATPLVHAYLIFAFFLFAGLLPAAWIYTHSNELKYFYVFLQAGHIALLSGFAFYLNLRKDIRETRMYLQDDEAFFAIYPRERKRVERARRRDPLRVEKSHRKRMRQKEKEWARKGL